MAKSQVLVKRGNSIHAIANTPKTIESNIKDGARPLTEEETKEYLSKNKIETKSKTKRKGKKESLPVVEEQKEIFEPKEDEKNTA